MNEMTDVETLLGREFDQVAADLQIPAQPPTPATEPASPRRWVAPLAVAAAVLALVAGVTVVLSHRDNTPEPTDGIPRTLPMVPFTVGRTLYVDGKAMPGRWSAAVTAGNSWIAGKKHRWWWGLGRDAHRMQVAADSMPVLSSDGAVLAVPQRRSGPDRIQVLSTRTGKVLGTWHVDLGKAESADAPLLGAVTSPEVHVILRTAETTRVWNLSDGRVHRLPKDLSVMWSTPMGLVFADTDLHFHLGTVDDAGHAHLGRRVHRADVNTLSADGWSARGVQLLAVHDSGNGDRAPTAIEVSRLGGARARTIPLPSGWAAINFDWEAPGRIVADGVRVDQGHTGPDQNRLIRCVVSLNRCAVVD